MDAAGIVVVGGRSSRMGSPKAELEWDGSTLLFRTAAMLRATLTGPVVVVGAADQYLPDLPDGVEIGRDAVAGRGPLEGLAGGFAIVGARARIAFLCATDMPMLHPAYVRRVLAELADDSIDVALPYVHGYRQPLAAGYRATLAPLVSELLEAGQHWPHALFEHCSVRALSEADLLADPDLAAADPELHSVLNVNDPAEYASVRARFEGRP
ncbi:MAG: molybdenum cofactor guanylyltransferase [Sporichthyaceae bacterium]